jgi:hypothetical protein
VINAGAATSPLDVTLRRLVLAVAALTAVSGAVQMVLPDLVLRFIGGSSTPSTRHFFGLVGMFMLIVGVALWVAVRDGSSGVVLVLAAQKAGAVGGVVIGVANGIFGPTALLVAGFDALSCLLILWYWQRSRP